MDIRAVNLPDYIDRPMPGLANEPSLKLLMGLAQTRPDPQRAANFLELVRLWIENNAKPGPACQAEKLKS
jgi:hypothetical protein